VVVFDSYSMLNDEGVLVVYFGLGGISYGQWTNQVVVSPFQVDLYIYVVGESDIPSYPLVI